MRVNDEMSAYCTREIALKEAIMGGYTTGAVLQALRQYANANPFSENDLVVLIFLTTVLDTLPKYTVINGWKNKDSSIIVSIITKKFLKQNTLNKNRIQMSFLASDFFKI